MARKYRLKRIFVIVICLIFCISTLFSSNIFVSANAAITKSNADLVIKVGETTRLEAVLSLIQQKNYPSNVTIKWTSSAPAAVKVDAKGSVTGVSQGGATITATVIHGEIPFVASVTVYAQSTVTGVKLNKTNLGLMVGEQQKLEATVEPSSAFSKTVTWKTSNSKIATVSKGTVKGIAPGTAIITVVTSDGGYLATCSIVVSSMVRGIDFLQTNISLTIGEQKEIEYNIRPSDAYVKTVKWQTSNNKVATVTNGKVKGIGEGTAIITGITNDGGHQATCTVTVSSMVTGVVLNRESLALDKDESFTLTATVYPKNANEQGVTWETSNKEIATVSSGKVTGKSRGIATITATSKDGGHKASCEVIVASNDIPVTYVAVREKNITIYVGEQQQLEYTVFPSDASNKEVTLSSDGPNVKVSKDTITGVKPGTCVVTVKTKDGNYQDSCIVNVKAMVTGVNIISGKTTSIYIGEKKILSAQVIPSSALVKTVTWESSDPKVVTVNKSTGEIKGIAKGTAFVSAISNDSGIKDYCTVTVINMVTDIKIREKTISIGVDGKFQPTLIVSPADFYEESIYYIIDDPSIASVDKNGVILGKKQGNTTFRVKTIDGGIEDTSKVEVTTNANRLLIYDERGNLISSSDNWVFEEPAKPNKQPDILKKDEITVIVNGEELSFDQPPILENNRVLVPFRAIFEKIGAEVSWDDATETITATSPLSDIELQIGSTTAYVNSTKNILDVPPKILNGRTLVPVRFISESMGLTVEWDDETQTVLISE